MTVYVLRASNEYADCYFIEECKTREEAKQVRINVENMYRPYVKEIGKYGK